MNEPEPKYSQVTQAARLATYPDEGRKHAFRLTPEPTCTCDKWKPNSKIIEDALVYAVSQGFGAVELNLWTHCPWCGRKLKVE